MRASKLNKEKNNSRKGKGENVKKTKNGYRKDQERSQKRQKI